MTYEDIINHHAEELKDYKAFNADTPEDMTKEEIAYYILLNSAMLYRYTADSKYLQVEDLAFIKSASDYVSGMTIINKLAEICDTDDFDDSDMWDSELLIQARDELEMVKIIVSEAIKPLVYKGDFELLDSLTVIKRYKDKFDSLILNDLSLLTVATREIYKLREFIKIDLEDTFWWFDKAREIDANFIRTEESIFNSIASAVASRNERKTEEKTITNQVGEIIRLVFKPLENLMNEPAIAFAAGSNYIIESEKLQVTYNDELLYLDWQLTQNGFLNYSLLNSEGNFPVYLIDAELRFFNDNVLIVSVDIEDALGSIEAKSHVDNLRVELVLPK